MLRDKSWDSGRGSTLLGMAGSFGRRPFVCLFGEFLNGFVVMQMKDSLPNLGEWLRPWGLKVSKEYKWKKCLSWVPCCLLLFGFIKTQRVGIVVQDVGRWERNVGTKEDCHYSRMWRPQTKEKNNRLGTLHHRLANGFSSSISYSVSHCSSQSCNFPITSSLQESSSTVTIYH